MDEKSRQVASEIVEAGMVKVAGPYGDTQEALNLKFLAVGDVLAFIGVGDFARRQSSAQESGKEAIALREKVAADIHRSAASLVTLGAKVAVMAMRLDGQDEAEAIAVAGQTLRSDLRDDGLPDDAADQLLTYAFRNYVTAAAELYALNHDDQASYESFALGLMGSVVAFGVAAAASARATEGA
jgi:hypothetical protein